MFVWIRKLLYWSYITICIRALHPLWKGKSSILLSQTWSSHHSSAWCSCMLHRIIHRISRSLCYYLLVQLPPLNELYEERNWNAHTCANSRHQLLLSNFTECLGTRLGNTLPLLYAWCYLGSWTLTFTIGTQLASCDSMPERKKEGQREGECMGSLGQW